MLFRASTTIALAAALAFPAIAADLPEVKISASNPVPACATPGRLMAYLHSRNAKVNPRYEGVATEYMRLGEQLGIRWDMAFFQMVLETGALSYTGDVRADQNNFAGLGASGGGAHGERFTDISSGVKAHLQHLLMYAGDHIDNPVAERTKNVQEWGVLTEWQRTIKGPMTYTILARQWAPGSRGYSRDIAGIADGFYDGYCNKPDPNPEMLAEARQGRGGATHVAAASADPAPLTKADAVQGYAPKADAKAPAKVAAIVPDPSLKAKVVEKATEKTAKVEPIAKPETNPAEKADAIKRATEKAEAVKKAKTEVAAKTKKSNAPSATAPAYMAAAASIRDGTVDPAAPAKDRGATDPAIAEPAAAAEPAATMQVAAKEPDAATAPEAPKVSGAEIARRNIEEERKQDQPRTGLGAAGMFGNGVASANAAAAEPAAEPAAKPAMTILNGVPSDQAATAEKAGPKKETDKGAAIQTAAITGAATQLKVPSAANDGKCKVWTASYGGQRAILIKAATKDAVNYTVLDVNDTTEQREIDAYISAYAKGGQSIGTFTNQTKALDKAFELCPEG